MPQPPPSPNATPNNNNRIRNSVGGFAAGDFAWRNSICAWSLAHETAQPLVLEDAMNDAR